MSKMFKEVNLDPVGFESTWKVDRQWQNIDSQTKEIETTSKTVGTNTSQHAETQTVTCSKGTDTAKNDDTTEEDVNEFLKRIFPTVIRELETTVPIQGLLDRAFAEEADSDITLDQDLEVFTEKRGIEAKIPVTCLSWNTTGNTVAVGCTRSHESWCAHLGIVSVYSLNKDDKFPDEPNKQLSCDSCTVSLCFHPVQPSILAVGTYSGSVAVYNIQNEDGDGLAMMSSLHEEIVSQLTWVSQSHGSPLLISADTDGYIVVWQVSISTSTLTPNNRLKFGSSRVATDDKYTSKSVDNRGVLSLDFSKFLPEIFVAALEGNELVQGSLLNCKPAAESAIVGRPVFDPYITSYLSHDAEICRVCFSPHNKDIFASAAADLQIRIYNIGKVAPIQTIFLGNELSDISWVPKERNFILGCECNGTLQIFGLDTGRLLPQAAEQDSRQYNAVAINPVRSNCILVGDKTGRIQRWTIPWQAMND